MRLDTWVSYDVAYRQPLPCSWRCARPASLLPHHGLAIDRYYCAGKSLLTHFVMKHHHYEAGTRKKRPASRVFFFLPAFGRCYPSVSAHPANSIRCSSKIAIAVGAHARSKMIMNSVCTNISMIVSRALFAESCCSCWCYPLMHALGNLFFTRDMACYL